LFHVEDVAVWLVGVSNGVDGAGDLSEEVGAWSIRVREELIGDKRIGDLGDATVGGGIGVGGGSF
jgi:hypothetical protein